MNVPLRTVVYINSDFNNNLRCDNIRYCFTDRIKEKQWQIMKRISALDDEHQTKKSLYIADIK